MKQVYIIQENNPKLLLFFAGWAADETPFKQYRPKDMDYMICYDYRTLDFDASFLERYRQVNVVAWSMGVWVASVVLRPLPKEKFFGIAFNGTIHPISDEEGIPIKTFHATLNNLTPASLQKFMRRMCKDSKAYRAFLDITPRRDFDEIKQELELLEQRYIQLENITINKKNGYDYPENFGEDDCGDDQFEYTYSFIGKNDRIFPPQNLILSYECMEERNRIVADCAHYDELMFRFLLQDVWSLTIDDFFKQLEAMNTGGYEYEY